MSNKTDFVGRLLSDVEIRTPLPQAPLREASLLEQGAVIVLMRHLTQKQAEASVESLRAVHGDWNETRVSQAQEIASHLKSSIRMGGMARLNELRLASMTLKAYLQDVFQQTHGMDLEHFREDLWAAGEVVADLTVLGTTGGAYVLWLAADGAVPAHKGLVRILSRLDLMKATTSSKRATESLEGLIPPGRELEFTITFHEILEGWTHPEEPIYMQIGRAHV
mgnify:CR=1 FL=1